MTEPEPVSAGTTPGKLDRRILEVFDTGLLLSPAIVADNLDEPLETVRQRTTILQRQGLLDQESVARYRITDRGRQLLACEIEAGELTEADVEDFHADEGDGGAADDEKLSL